MIHDFPTQLGLEPDGSSTPIDRSRMLEFLNLKLAARGIAIYGDPEGFPFLRMAQSLLANYAEKNRLLAGYLCPADARIQAFLADYLKDVAQSPDERWIPAEALILEQHGMARTLSLPPDADEFRSDIVRSCRVQQGVCHNPKHDRRTTKGVFHVAAGGFPVPYDKKEVPKGVFANLLRAALNPPRDLLQLPFTYTQKDKAEVFVSMLLRPLLSPAVPNVAAEQSIEVRFFAPGNLVSNLDFVESIFGNAGDPFLPDSDAGLDVEHWSGHTGGVILAPHLINLRKKALGLPHVSEATPRQVRDGMCWEREDEKYNDGEAFKATCRDHRGVIVTVIADNYFGYCKKEVKTQISYAANLFGMCEEEHAGGALAFPSFDLGEDFRLSEYVREVDHSYDEIAGRYPDQLIPAPSGYAVDRQYPDIHYLPEDAHILLREQRITWMKDGKEQTLKLLPNITYVMPSGYKVEMRKPSESERWRLIGTQAEGTFCHKPSTVSGGGKSEISKPITDSTIEGPIMVSDFKEDFDLVEAIINRDYTDRYQHPLIPGKPARPLLSPDRSLGSVVKLLSYNPDYTEDYNAWLATIPQRIRDLVLLVKRFYKPHWGADWRSRFSVDSVNGRPGNELKYRKEKLRTRYIRVGFEEGGAWRTFSLRKDFAPAHKIQTEDDISVSTVVPAPLLRGLHPNLKQYAYKFVQNCEYRLFQRPDEAIVRGYDKTAEADFSRDGNFFSNYEPLTRAEAREMVEDAILFDQFSEPIQRVIREFVEHDSPEFLVSTSHPRVVNGARSKNPRYLQTRPDLEQQREVYLAQQGARLHRRLGSADPVYFPVNSVLPGRRNNPPDKQAGIRSLAVYNPVHYQEWPELFMEFIASLTGKSPSTTGAGSEGALTKAPFNAMPPIVDLNNALVSYLLTGNGAFTTSAGFIGPKYRFDHDISLLVPEIWSRMFIHEREPQYLIENGFLEPVPDVEHNGRTYLASRLGYRITERFVGTFFGRVFSDPAAVFTEDMLRPEMQDLESYLDGVDNIVSTQKRVARQYFDDGSVELACPPLKALLHIMVHGGFEGLTAASPEFRAMFTREAMLASDWYRDRLEARRQVELALWRKHKAYLEDFQGKHTHDLEAKRLNLAARLEACRRRLSALEQMRGVDHLVGTLGTDPSVLPA